MEKVTQEDGQSADIVGENVGKLKELFPDAFKEGIVDFDILRQLLGDSTVLEEGDEKYGLNWHGKKKARQIALTPSMGTLLPSTDKSVDWDSTGNLFIEGDNLEVLKQLQKSYAKAVKLIFVDPPYNTGKEFIYPDKFQDNLDTYLKYTRQVDSEGMKFSSNTESGGRMHTNWLNMMQPRLRLSRNLLSDDGYVVVCIDDAEFQNLKFLMNEIFGEENQIATLVWDRNRKNDAKFFSVGHEYWLIYAKSKQHLKDNGVVLREPKPGIEEAENLFAKLRAKHSDDWEKVQDDWRAFYAKIPSDDDRKKLGRYSKVGARGPYRDDGNISWPGGGGPKYEVLHPETKKPCKVPDGGWRYSKPERFWEDYELGKVVFGPDETTLPRQCRYLFEGDGQVMPSVFYSYAQTAAVEFNDLMGGRVFENPKNWRDIERLVAYLTEPDDLVLDFFAGSCSTAHAVLHLNAVKDEAPRRFVMVQLPEPIDPKDVAYSHGYRTIADIGRARIAKACAQIQDEFPDSLTDVGFRAFELASSSIKAWDPDISDLEGTLLESQSHIVHGRSENDLLYELLLKRGVNLSTPIETRSVGDCPIYSVGFGVLIACLATSIPASAVDEIANAILEWHRELEPETDTHVFFRDSAFEDDIAKTNMAAILEQNGITHVRSL